MASNLSSLINTVFGSCAKRAVSVDFPAAIFPQTRCSVAQCRVGAWTSAFMELSLFKKILKARFQKRKPPQGRASSVVKKLVRHGGNGGNNRRLCEVMSGRGHVSSIT